jgi:hypothetical protein
MPDARPGRHNVDRHDDHSDHVPQSTERVRLTPPIPSARPSDGSARLLWVAILSALFVFSALGAYVLRTSAPSAAETPNDPAAESSAAPSPAAAPDSPAAVAANSKAIAARTAEQVWTDLEPAGQANLCKAWHKYPKDAIRGAFLKMAASPRATFTVEGATTVQVWDALAQRLKRC